MARHFLIHSAKRQLSGSRVQGCRFLTQVTALGSPDNADVALPVAGAPAGAAGPPTGFLKHSAKKAWAGATPDTTSEEALGSGSRIPPGLAEDARFQLDESVAAWKDFKRDGPGLAMDDLREAISIASSIAAQGPQGAQYALAHGMRTSYFAANAALGTLAFELRERVKHGRSGAELADDLGIRTEDHPPAQVLLEVAMCFQQDFRAINDRKYKAPWDMYTPGHRQLAPWRAAQQTASLVKEAVATFGRRSSGLRQDIGIWLDSPLYPDYYKNNFHYQTDGWMSTRSAQIYETSTETLFIGRQDAMQRLSLLPLRDVAGANDGAPRILEVACGTGRFATFIRDNHPTAHFTAVDLSPFYLEAARENDEYWRKMRYPIPIEETRLDAAVEAAHVAVKEAVAAGDTAAQLQAYMRLSQAAMGKVAMLGAAASSPSCGNSGQAVVDPPSATFVQAAAEALPFEDACFDAVVCVYLFHEMPEAARAAAAAEIARVVAPGGTVVLTDSVQRGDRSSLDNEERFDNFSKLNEPHYLNYIDTYLPGLFLPAGLTCDRKWVESSTKCLSFRKPA